MRTVLVTAAAGPSEGETLSGRARPAIVSPSTACPSPPAGCPQSRGRPRRGAVPPPEIPARVITEFYRGALPRGSAVPPPCSWSKSAPSTRNAGALLGGGTLSMNRTFPPSLSPPTGAPTRAGVACAGLALTFELSSPTGSYPPNGVSSCREVALPKCAGTSEVPISPDGDAPLRERPSQLQEQKHNGLAVHLPGPGREVCGCRILPLVLPGEELFAQESLW